MNENEFSFLERQPSSIDLTLLRAMKWKFPFLILVFFHIDVQHNGSKTYVRNPGTEAQKISYVYS